MWSFSCDSQRLHTDRRALDNASRTNSARRFGVVMRSEDASVKGNPIGWMVNRTEARVCDKYAAGKGFTVKTTRPTSISATNLIDTTMAMVFHGIDNVPPDVGVAKRPPQRGGCNQACVPG